MNEKVIFENKASEFITRLKILQMDAYSLGLNLTGMQLGNTVLTALNEKSSKLLIQNDGKGPYTPEHN